MITHVLYEGVTPCAMPGPPDRWPYGHDWVELNDWLTATCDECCATAARLLPLCEQCKEYHVDCVGEVTCRNCRDGS